MVLSIIRCIESRHASVQLCTKRSIDTLVFTLAIRFDADIDAQAQVRDLRPRKSRIDTGILPNSGTRGQLTILIRAD